MNITVIQYRQNGNDVCRGCHMGSSDSDLKILHTTDQDEAAKQIGHCLFKDKVSDREYCDYDIFILQNGIGPDEHDCVQDDNDVYDDAITYIIMKQAKVYADAKYQNHLEEKANAAAEQTRIENEHKKEEDLALLKKLKDQYGDK